jgi:hypothetical protein
MAWLLSSSSDRRALDVVDGMGKHAGKGPHYSRRTPGSKTFTGVGREIVLVTDDGNAVWAVVLQKTSCSTWDGIQPRTHRERRRLHAVGLAQHALSQPRRLPVVRPDS